MNLSTLKLLIWVASLATLGGLAWYVHDYVQNMESLRASRASMDRQRQVLDSVPQPEPPRLTLVHPSRIEANFHNLNWTGKLAPPPPPPPPKEEPEVKAPVRPDLATVLRVLYVEVDTDAPASSLALLHYLRPGLLSNNQTTATVRMGDRLPREFQNVRVAAIGADGVRFEFDAFPDEPQTIETWSPFESGIISVAPGEARERRVRAIPRGPGTGEAFRPENTVERRPGIFTLGTEDMAAFERDHLQILSSEVRHRSWRNPRTGRYEGVEIQDVAAGSLVAKHGVKSGDVIKSINGHPVNSVNQAIHFVKTNAELYTTWEVVLENAGKPRTLVFESP